MKLVVIAIVASILGFLEARFTNLPVLAAIGIGVAGGVVWTALAFGVSRWIRRHRTLDAANGSALAVALVATMLLTPGLLLETMMFPTADAYLTMIQSGAGSGTVAFYATFNPLTEWILVPLALYFNWPHTGRRRVAIAAATVYYLERASTYLYFAVQILHWQHTPKTPDLLAAVDLWLSVDWTRMAVDGLMILAFVALTFLRPRHPTPTSESYA
ncbi:hypothetical protein [Fodinicola acaciae]|uniref:hypothetical protein n=1 Tax=Fodinicola acaciae TaxID=2681555 RepID=UPI0013D22CC0|nr:hypothetical protein [Fodinicola acaciae]